MNLPIPEGTYGVTEREVCGDYTSVVIEQIYRLGYAVVDVGISEDDVEHMKLEFDRVQQSYIHKYGLDYLQSIGEHNTVRMPLSESEQFRCLASNENLHLILGGMIKGTYILNQQNGIINPPHEGYSQGSWHRDLPYQHFTVSRPIAVNALYCVDDFTRSNGATFVLPGSHLHASFPSLEYVQRHAVQIEAAAGSFIVMDCMLFHSGGRNTTDLSRRAVNHVFTIPYFKQQISMTAVVDSSSLTEFQSRLFSMDAFEPSSVEQYLSRRKVLK